MTEIPDYIIVGAGSAGCVMANRLTKLPGTTVTLIEAGKKTSSLYVRMPAGFAYAIKNKRLNWDYRSEPEDALDGRRLRCSRGKGLGGSSLINALAFTRGLPTDYDDWSASTRGEWTYERCLPFFKSIETFSLGGSTWRGGSGPLHVRQPRLQNALNEHFLRACDEAGHELSGDPNGENPLGFGPMDQTIVDGRRDSAYTAFVEPIMERRNLRIETSVEIDTILFEGRTARGVAGRRNGARFELRANREVILAAGAINSPYLLMRSGIGPGEAITAHGLEVVYDSREVGQNLQDHLDITIRHTSRLPISDTFILTPLRKLAVGVQWILARRGPGATNHFEVGGYLLDDLDRLRPKIHVVFMPLLVGYDGVPPLMQHGFQATAMLLRPGSRGSVTLVSGDGLLQPSIRFNALSADDDLARLVEAVWKIREIYRQPSIAGICEREIAPGMEADDEADIGRYILETVKSTDHACGTCRMGADQNSVANPCGEVRGVEGLRVVDASLMPSIPSANINAAVMMMAERIASQIDAR